MALAPSGLPLPEDVQDWLDALQPTLLAAGDAARAQGEKAYLKSELEFVGTGVPFIRATAKSFRRAFPAIGHDALLEVVRIVWEPPVHELRSLAIALLEVHRSRLVPDDLALVEAILRECRTWAHVDWLAVKVAGDLIARHPDADALLERWSRDPWMWLRRSALLAHLETLREGGGDFARFARLAAGMLGEREFFIRKAIGWILRDVSRKRPELAFGFLEAHIGAVSGLTLREGSRHLPDDLQAALRARHQAR